MNAPVSTFAVPTGSLHPVVEAFLPVLSQHRQRASLVHHAVAMQDRARIAVARSRGVVDRGACARAALAVDAFAAACCVLTDAELRHVMAMGVCNVTVP